MGDTHAATVSTIAVVSCPRNLRSLRWGTEATAENSTFGPVSSAARWTAGPAVPCAWM